MMMNREPQEMREEQERARAEYEAQPRIVEVCQAIRFNLGMTQEDIEFLRRARIRL